MNKKSVNEIPWTCQLTMRLGNQISNIGLTLNNAAVLGLTVPVSRAAKMILHLTHLSYHHILIQVFQSEQDFLEAGKKEIFFWCNNAL